MTAPCQAFDAEVPPLARSHAIVVAMLARALRAGDDAAWDGLEAALELRLTRVERARLLMKAIKACAAEDAVQVMDAALGELTGAPGPRFGPIAEEAASWAAMATIAEVKHYLLAGVNRLPKADRVRFLRAMQKGLTD